jgi:3-mercaptopyruvate sulfurtransferase SseA
MKNLKRACCSAAFSALALLWTGAHSAEPLPSLIGNVEMLSRLNQSWVQILDVRSAPEFKGDVVRTLRSGRLPGAVNAPEITQDLLAKLQKNRETIVYGFDTESAAVAAEKLKAHGFGQVRILNGGWQAWGNRVDLPASDSTLVDVDAMQSRLLALERRLANN